MKHILNTFVYILIFFVTLSFAHQNWEITTGCSGGITGGGNGFRVLHDGKLFQWQASTPTAFSKKLLGEIDREAAKTLHARLEAIAFKDIDFSESSNMTCSLTLREDSMSHQINWPVSGPFPPQGVVEIFQDIEALGKRHAQ